MIIVIPVPGTTPFPDPLGAWMARSWALVGRFPAWYAQRRQDRRQRRSWGGRWAEGCLGVAVFGLGWLLVVPLAWLTIEAALVALALLATLVWLVATPLRALRRHRYRRDA